MRRGQTEIMGLVVIFILFLFIGLIYFRFSGTAEAEPMSTSRSYVEGSNMVNSMMAYSICKDNSFRDALKGCIEGESSICGENSCDAVKTTAEGIVKAVMANESYQFTLVAAGNEIVKVPKTDVKCGTSTVNTFNNTIIKDAYIRIKICKKGTETKQ